MQRQFFVRKAQPDNQHGFILLLAIWLEVGSSELRNLAGGTTKGLRKFSPTVRKSQADVRLPETQFPQGQLFGKLQGERKILKSFIISKTFVDS